MPSRLHHFSLNARSIETKELRSSSSNFQENLVIWIAPDLTGSPVGEHYLEAELLLNDFFDGFPDDLLVAFFKNLCCAEHFHFSFC